MLHWLLMILFPLSYDEHAQEMKLNQWLPAVHDKMEELM